MTSAFLQTELASLIQDSKRKHGDVRAAAERSLGDLKSISVTSETQLAGDLLRKPQFIDPFIIACNSGLSKLAVTGAVCLQRLLASKAVPRGRLTDVLDAFHEASTQGLDVQLKILQALPSLLQLYATELQGEPLAKVLSLCAGLAASKTGMVSSTAAATFQQLITSVFERISGGQGDSENGPGVDKIAVSDACKVFADMCMVVKSEDLQFLKVSSLSTGLALEVIENCLSNDELRILELDDCLSACQTYLLSGIAAILEQTNNFAVFGQCLRIAYLLFASQISSLAEGLVDVLYIIMEWLDRGVAGSWKRILSLEFMRDVCSEFDILKFVYTSYDDQEDYKNVVQDLMSILVRISAEDPSLIGLGRQSTIPTNSAGDDNDVFVGSVDMQDLGAIGSVVQANSSVTGISTKWSTMSTPLLEQMDRKHAPDVPETYVYTLVLACVAAFSDGLSKYIMPLSVPTRSASKGLDATTGDENVEVVERKVNQRSQRYQRLMNPLGRSDLANAKDVQISADMIENCWPAVLATCSTFLNSALDSYFYHILVRTVQKLAQVSGVMELFTPRDALLTSLAKVSVPLNSPSIIAALHGNKQAKLATAESDTEDDLESIKSPVSNTPRPSVDVSRHSLNVRNLLCLRALLNLGIALGPTLSEASWFIIVQTLQHVEALMSVSAGAKSTPNTPNPQAVDGEGQATLATEITAVGTASKRLVESTRTYTDSALETFAKSLFKLIDNLMPSVLNGSHEHEEPSAKRPTLTPRTPTHRSTRSFSGVILASSVLLVEAEFVLKTMSDLARVNLHRFATPDSKPVSWDLIVDRLLHIVSLKDIVPPLRLQAASIIDIVAMETVKLLEKARIDPYVLDSLQQSCLQALVRQLGLLYRSHHNHPDILTAEIEMHRRLLDALENIVSHAGDSLKQGWRVVFQVLQLTVRRDDSDLGTTDATTKEQVNEEISVRTVTTAFRTIQLIVSDFLDSIDPESLWVLVQLLPLFGRQNHDLNISLTTATLFWNINRLILERTQTLQVSSSLSSGQSPVEGPDTVIASETSTLWFATMMHLAELCSDDRPEVRNGSLRVLLRMFDASSDQLTPEMWNLSIQKVLLSTLKYYAVAETQNGHWHASFSQLLEGTTSLLGQHPEAIVRTPAFLETWAEFVSVYRIMLKQKTASGYDAVYTSAGELLQTLTSAQAADRVPLQQLFQLWSEFHPADLEDITDSSSTEFAVHAQVLKKLDDCSAAVLTHESSDKNALPDLIMHSTKRTLLEVQHGKYSDDIKKLSAEQEAALENVVILRRITMRVPKTYSMFLLELVRGALAMNRPPKRSVINSKTKSIPRPKLIAFMVHCLELLRAGVPESMTGRDWLDDAAISPTLAVLSEIIQTKYSPIPVNDVSPAWQKATIVAVEIFEAIGKRSTGLQESDITQISLAALSTTRSILNAPALTSKSPAPSSDTILADENFDIEQAHKLHKAVGLLFSQYRFPKNDCIQYALILFKASLIAEPWYGDFPQDLEHRPLHDFGTVREGSIRRPDFYVRRKISHEALACLLDLTTRHQSTDPADEAGNISNLMVVAESAAPYSLLRVAHAVKTFLADQRLRYLTPPPRPLQHELNLVLNSALDLSCLDEAFHHLEAGKILHADGKTHLRILEPLVLQLQTFWVTLPRLRICAWQDDEDGAGIENALRNWTRRLAVGLNEDVSES